MKKNKAIELKGLMKRFDDITSVNSLNLDIYEGEVCAREPVATWSWSRVIGGFD